jgi:hypothetical protein
MPTKECDTKWTWASLKIIIMGNLSKKEGQKPIELFTCESGMAED